ncbi:hypothetical protein C1646_711367, partial [Rhizophagus diaphanus]
FLSCILPIISFCLLSLLFVSHHSSSSSHHFFSSSFLSLITLFHYFSFTPFHLLLLSITPLLFHFFI